METKTARLTLLIDPVKKKTFEELCAAQDLTPSQVVRQMSATIWNFTAWITPLKAGLVQPEQYAPSEGNCRFLDECA